MQDHTPTFIYKFACGVCMHRTVIEYYFIAYQSCIELLNAGYILSGVYVIKPSQSEGLISVYCDQFSRGGGNEFIIIYIKKFSIECRKQCGITVVLLFFAL